MVSTLSPMTDKAPQPRRRVDDSVRAQRNRVGARAITAALAAGVPAAASAEDVMSAWQAPQAQVIQVQATVPAAGAESPIVDGEACIALTSANHATAAILRVQPGEFSSEIVSTTAPGAMPAAENCVTAADYDAYVRERIAGFAQMTADYAGDILERAGRDPAGVHQLLGADLPDDPLRAYGVASNVFRQANDFGRQQLGNQFSSHTLRADMMVDARRMAAELGVWNQMQIATSQLKAGLDDGSLQPAAGADDDASIERLRFESGPETRPVTKQAAAPVAAPVAEHRRTLAV
ncbi:MAG: hypothetical protein AAF556_03075 [Pseudomonadota bacterium]